LEKRVAQRLEGGEPVGGAVAQHISHQVYEIAAEVFEGRKDLSVGHEYFAPRFGFDVGKLELANIVAGVHFEYLRVGGAPEHFDDLYQLIDVAVALK
jgi:hypothetical protein